MRGIPTPLHMVGSMIRAVGTQKDGRSDKWEDEQMDGWTEGQRDDSVEHGAELRSGET